MHDLRAARPPYVVLFDLIPLNKDGNWQVCTVCMCKKEKPEKLSEHTSEHVKSQNFLGACPQTPLTQDGFHFLYLPWAPTILSAALQSCDVAFVLVSEFNYLDPGQSCSLVYIIEVYILPHQY